MRIQLLIVLVIATLGLGQVRQPTFEVATVKPTTVFGPPSKSPGRFIAVGLPLKSLIGQAYRLRNYQVLGGPDWISTDLWEIQAKIPEGVIVLQPSAEMVEKTLTTPDTVDLMLQSLLEERFQLRIRRETRELPVYELSVAGGGLKMTQAADQSPLVIGAGAERMPTVPRTLARGSLSIRNGPDRRTLEVKALPLSQVVNVFVNELSKPVIDRTGLKGLYDLKLEWTPENLQTVPENRLLAAPLLTTAVQEQLGLKLESTRGPVEVLVVESAQKPSEN